MTIPFKEHLNTNYTPTDKERQEILRMLPEPEAQLLRMNNEIERLQAIIDDLKRQHDDLVQHIDQYCALTSPIRWITQEILQEILIHCLPTDHNAIMTAHEAPLMLGRVCSSWRLISISTPRLWTTVHVPIPNGFDNLYPEEITHADYEFASKHIADLRTAALQEWLNRSRSLAVDISFTQGDSLPTDVLIPQLRHSYPIVNTILSVAHRWRKISIAAPAQTMMRFLTHPPDELLFLESSDFNFSLAVWGPISRISQSDHNIYRTTSLRKLSLMQALGDCL
ncbi:hypothetical protein K443DRAFT_9375 [Laccaria amethystina LaAM-08-1]|jgi:hypothetical protein|uniref:F-box domain-containing protein n=1 Tax=Laccaria amethystina LaAM-08-1 TaxID=1095629 RepID=A0A0C9X9R8_9AGAR|nr:hypothetical protein K443DRAFT_9375 [Laccaria amethystina LaAM-08-1]